MIRRLVLIVIAIGIGLALLAPTANARVTILGDNGQKVDTIAKGKCRVSGKKGSKDFFLTAKSKAGKFALTAFIDSPVFTGFHDDYTIFYGGSDPQVFLHRNSDDEVFSNFKIPGTPAGAVGGGAIKFGKGGRKVGIGLSPASSKSFTEGYSFAGVIRCKYRKRK